MGPLHHDHNKWLKTLVIITLTVFQCTGMNFQSNAFTFYVKLFNQIIVILVSPHDELLIFRRNDWMGVLGVEGGGGEASQVPEDLTATAVVDLGTGGQENRGQMRSNHHHKQFVFQLKFKHKTFS